MITTEQLLHNRSIDDQTIAELILEVAWNETSLGHIQRILADAVDEEIFDSVDILDYDPISYDSTKKTFQMKYTLGVVDLLDLIEEN
jgi:hypothetical protein